MNIKNLKKEWNNKNYVVVKNVFNKQTLDIIYNYCKLKSDNLHFFILNPTKFFYREEIDGTLNDTQCKNAASFYVDPLMEVLLVKFEKLVSSIIDKQIEPIYSYWRMYFKGSELIKHKDLRSEISITLFIGSENNYKWPLFIEIENKKKEINLSPGDLCIYNGLKCPHWREKYTGEKHAQVFFHYNDIKNKKSKTFDGRHRIGLPLTRT
jgi:hypothetical protein